jgi:hypothetical protein
MKIERFDEGVDHMDWVVVSDPLPKTFRQQRQLGSVRAFNETPHGRLPSALGNPS